MAKRNPRSSNGGRYRAVRARLKAMRQPCWICREFGRAGDIDYSLPAGDPRSFELDHLEPVSKGGSLYDLRNCAATHRACNEWRGSKSVAEVKAIAAAQRTGAATTSAPVVHTTDW
ncbi:MAG: HNH endonuclease [Atopobiaceae bacterium]